MSSFALRLASGGAVAATAAVLLVAPGSAQAHTQVAPSQDPTSLSIRILDTKVGPEESASIRGHLVVTGSATPGGRTIVLEARPLGTDEFVPVAQDTTGDRGGVSAVVTPQVTTRYRWHFSGDDNTRASTSGVGAIRVTDATHPTRRLATSLSIREVHRVTDAGIIDLVRGQLRAGRVVLPRRPVILLSRSADDADWTYEGTHRTQRRGVVRFVVDPAQDTAYRLVFLGTTRLLPAHSAIVRVAHRPDVAITVDPLAIVRGESITITGVVTDNGAPLVGATVALFAVRVREPGARRLVETGVTTDDGSVTFAHTPRVSTKYRLRVAASEGTPGALSPVVRVVLSPPPA
jgi:hypothetical protein